MIFLVYGIALVLDQRFGWPHPLFETIGHPVSWFGQMIAAGERHLNKGGAPARRIKGGAFSIALVLLVFGMACAIENLVIDTLSEWSAVAVLAVLTWPFLAANSMRKHILAIIKPLEAGDIKAGRQAVSMIVGRDPKQLDENGIRRAAIESLAENTSDGVVAPIFWGLILGLPGIAAYKMINTLDSMIGYRNARFACFGFVAARLDDVANWVPARLTAFLFAIIGRRPDLLWGLPQEAAGHRSPNAGWPEAMMARILNVRLSGPRVYEEGQSDDPWLNADAADPDNQALVKALGLFQKLIHMLIALFFVTGVIYLCLYVAKAF